MHGCALVVVPLISRAFLLAQQPLQEIHVTCKEQNIWIRCTDAYVNCRVCMGLQNKTTEQTKYTVRGRLGRFPEISQVQIFKSVWAAVQHRMPRCNTECSATFINSQAVQWLLSSYKKVVLALVPPIVICMGKPRAPFSIKRLLWLKVINCPIEFAFFWSGVQTFEIWWWVVFVPGIATLAIVFE